MHERSILALTALALVGLAVIDIPDAHAGESSIHGLLHSLGMTGAAGPDGSLVTHVGQCTAVVQPDQAGGIKVFSFVGPSVDAGASGLSEDAVAKLKLEFGNPRMTTDELLARFENSTKPEAKKYLELLKSSCQGAPLTS